MSDNPIFTELVRKYQMSGRSLPWVYSVKPRGTIGALNETTQGIQPYFNLTYVRGHRGEA